MLDRFVIWFECNGALVIAHDNYFPRVGHVVIPRSLAIRAVGKMGFIGIVQVIPWVVGIDLLVHASTFCHCHVPVYLHL